MYVPVYEYIFTCVYLYIYIYIILIHIILVIDIGHGKTCPYYLTSEAQIIWAQ